MFLLASLSMCGCLPADLCDSDQIYSDGVCIEPPVDAGTRDAIVADAGPFVGYGATCATSTDCGPLTDYCAIPTGQTQGYCTHTGCLAEPSVCPPFWGCVDLSVYGAEAPSVCTLAGGELDVPPSAGAGRPPSSASRSWRPAAFTEKSPLEPAVAGHSSPPSSRCSSSACAG